MTKIETPEEKELIKITGTSFREITDYLERENIRYSSGIFGYEKPLRFHRTLMINPDWREDFELNFSKPTRVDCRGKAYYVARYKEPEGSETQRDKETIVRNNLGEIIEVTLMNNFERTLQPI